MSFVNSYVSYSESNIFFAESKCIPKNLDNRFFPLFVATSAFVLMKP